MEENHLQTSCYHQQGSTSGILYEGMKTTRGWGTQRQKLQWPDCGQACRTRLSKLPHCDVTELHDYIHVAQAAAVLLCGWYVGGPVVCNYACDLVVEWVVVRC